MSRSCTLPASSLCPACTQLVVAANRPPSNGTVVASPMSGVSLQTNFSVKVSHDLSGLSTSLRMPPTTPDRRSAPAGCVEQARWWTDAEADLPLTYTYYTAGSSGVLLADGTTATSIRVRVSHSSNLFSALRQERTTKCKLVISPHGTVRREGRSVPLSPWHDVMRVSTTPAVSASTLQTYLPSSRNLSVSIRATDTLGASTTAKG